jgi:hypothetical protein
MTLQAFDPDLRYPVPLAARLHAEHRARRASWRRLALPAPAQVEKPKEISAKPQPPTVIDPPRFDNSVFEKHLHERGIIHISTIIRVVGHHYGIGSKDILGSIKLRPIVKARAVAMYVAWMTGWNFNRIKSEFRRTDHTAVIHAVRKIERHATEDRELRLQIVDLFIACGGCEG